MDELLGNDRAALIGHIAAEILQGFPREAQADYVASLLRGVLWIEVIREDWVAAARLGRRCAAAGNQLPLSDLVLAAVAIRTEAEIFTSDPHFDLLGEAKRFHP